MPHSGEQNTSARIGQASLFCGHRYKQRVCVVERDHFGSHFDGRTHWTVGMKWPNWRGRKVGA